MVGCRCGGQKGSARICRSGSRKLIPGPGNNPLLSQHARENSHALGFSSLSLSLSLYAVIHSLTPDLVDTNTTQVKVDVERVQKMYSIKSMSQGGYFGAVDASMSAAI